MNKQAILKMARFALRHNDAGMARRVFLHAVKYGLIRVSMSMEEAKSTLGFEPYESPSEQEIMKAWREMALKNHPDRGGDVNVMQAVNVAKDVLTGKTRSTTSNEFDSGDEESYPENPAANPLADSMDFNKARSEAKKGVEWKFRSSYFVTPGNNLAKERARKVFGDTTLGNISYVQSYLVFGHNGSNYVFMLVENLMLDDGNTPGLEDWRMKAHTVMSYDGQDFEDVIKLGLASVWTKAIYAGGSSPSSSLLRKIYPLKNPLTEKQFMGQPGNMPLSEYVRMWRL